MRSPICRSNTSEISTAPMSYRVQQGGEQEGGESSSMAEKVQKSAVVDAADDRADHFNQSQFSTSPKLPIRGRGGLFAPLQRLVRAMQAAAPQPKQRR